MYDLDWLKQEIKKGTNLKYVFFWGHKPSLDGSITKSCFSQWWLSEFQVDNKIYKTAEHWMMEKKALLFGNDALAEEILNSESPAEAKKLGRAVKGFDEEEWVKHRFEYVVEGNFYKFLQNTKLKEYLLSTNDRVLVEASPVDFIWGIGLSQDAKNIENPENWKGLNLLGFALMEARDRLNTARE